MRILTEATLTKVLKLHKLWLETNGLKGELANLSRVDLFEADLRYFDLRRADLRGADLRGADLANVKSTVILATFQLNKYSASLIGDMLRIGCKHKTLKKWVKDGKSIGRNEGFTEVEIKNHLMIIKALKKLVVEK